MNITKSEQELKAKLYRDFNLNTVRELNHSLDEQIRRLTIDLSHCKLVDSEAIIFLDRWLRSGNKLELRNPPEIFNEIIELLKLDQIWDLSEILK
ncbi:MAG: hypothetical protein R3211_12165 [Balneolaceae bacterium]|nr:hypothetical protein [Balneolaceae bacterium]